MTAARAIDPPVKRMLSRVEAAAFCGVAPSTFDKMVKNGMAPQPVKIFTRNLFDLRKLEAALDALSGTVSERIEPNEWDEV